MVQASSNHEVRPNAKLVIPKAPNVYLPPRDDAAEFDDSGTVKLILKPLKKVQDNPFLDQSDKSIHDVRKT